MLITHIPALLISILTVTRQLQSFPNSLVFKAYLHGLLKNTELSFCMCIHPSQLKTFNIK